MGCASMRNWKQLIERALGRKYITDAEKQQRLRRLGVNCNSPDKGGLDKPTRTDYNGGHKSSKANKIPAKPKGRIIDNDTQAS